MKIVKSKPRYKQRTNLKAKVIDGNRAHEFPHTGTICNQWSIAGKLVTSLVFHHLTAIR